MPDHEQPDGRLSSDILARLAEVIEARKSADQDESYVASLLNGDVSRVLKKIGEEGVEFALAVRDGERDAIVHEAADLWFHVMVALSQAGVSPQEVMGELERRFGMSGLEEKRTRKS
ncbi:MAG: phosphoribosyl-ATP pyrophosphatase [marine bacterium B5-7]|nr:MAG: phosphoribosyl-ATP pyrophosphatase [marine bacterium B5-7]